MRVLLLNQYYAPDEAATAQLLADVGEGLAAAGDEVIAVSGDRGYADPERRYPSRETLRGVQVRRVGATGFGRRTVAGRLIDYLTFTFAASWSLGRVRAPDRVLSLSTPPWIGWLGWLTARAKGAAFVYWEMDVYPDVAIALGVLNPESWRARVLRSAHRRLLARADVVVALDEAMADRLRSTVDRPIAVVSNWADGDVVRPRDIRGHRLREAWGWADRFVVMYSGNLGRAHEFDTVLDAMEQLRDDPRILFAFVGDGPRREAVRVEAERRNLAADFRPYQPRESLGESLTAADVHLVTLRDGVEGTVAPSKLYGILAAGRAALYVGPAAGETHELLERSGVGVSLRCGDAEGLARAIRAAADGTFDLARAGRDARRMFEAEFTKRKGLARIRELLQSAGAPSAEPRS